MSLFTSNSEFDAEKHIQITNEMPPYDMYTGVNSVLQNDMWKWFLGYTKVTTDIDYNENPALTYTKKTNGNQSEVYGPKPKNLYTIDGKPIHTIPKFRSLEVNGALAVEQDLFLHEIYRYLDTLYPDHYDWRHLLTNNEINDAFTNAAAVVDYKPNNDFFDLVARNLEGIETEDEIEVESLKIKLRNLRNNAYRRKLYGSKIGYRMFCGDIFQLCSIYPLGTYTTLQPVNIKFDKNDTNEYIKEVSKENRIIDTLNQNYSKKFKLIDWENDLSIYEKESNKKYYFTNMTLPAYDNYLFEVPNSLAEDAVVDDIKIGMYIYNHNSTLDKLIATSVSEYDNPIYSSTTSTNDETRADDPEFLEKFYGFISHEFITIDCDLMDKAYFVWKLGTVNLKDVEDITVELTNVETDVTSTYKLTWNNNSIEKIDNGDAVRLLFKEGNLYEFELIPIEIVERQKLIQVNHIKTDSTIAPKYRPVYKIDFSNEALSKLDKVTREAISKRSVEEQIVFGDDILDSQGIWLFNILYDIPEEYKHAVSKEVNVLYNPFIDGTLFIDPKYTIDSYYDKLEYNIDDSDVLKKVNFIDPGHRLWETDFPLKEDDLFVRNTNWTLGDEYDAYGVVGWTRGKIKVESDGSLPQRTSLTIDPDKKYGFVFESGEKRRVLMFGDIINSKTADISGKSFWNSFEVGINVIPNDIEDEKLFKMVYPLYEEKKIRLLEIENIKNNTPDLYDNNLINEKLELERTLKDWEEHKGNREYLIGKKYDSENTEYDDYFIGISDRLIYVYEYSAYSDTWEERKDFGNYTIKNLNYGLLSVMPYIHKSRFVYVDDFIYGRRDYTRNKFINFNFEDPDSKKTCVQYFDFSPLRAHRKSDNDLPYCAFLDDNEYMFWGQTDHYNSHSQKPDSIQVEVRGLIDAQNDELKNVITFDDELSQSMIKSFNVGDFVYGPQIMSDNVYITEVGLDFIRVNNIFTESGHFMYKVFATNQCIPQEFDEFNTYKTEQVMNGHYNKVNIFNTAIYPTKTYPEVAKHGYISGLLDISQFSVYNKFDSFAKVMRVVYSDYIVEDNNIFPAIVKFENDLFIELNIRGLLKTPNKRGITPTLMNVEYLDYLCENLHQISRTTDSVSVGSSLILNSDTSGKFSLTKDAKWTDPSIHSKFQTFEWSSGTIPKYAQIGSAGEGYDSLFIGVRDKEWPHVYGVAVWDGYQEDFYEKYKEMIESDPEFKMRKRHVWTSLASTLERATTIQYKKDIEKPLFEVPLGEYDIQLDYLPEGTSQKYTTVQSNFYKQSFKNILIKNKIFNIKENEFISDDFIIGNLEDNILSDNKEYNLLRHKNLGIFNEIATSPYPEIKDDYMIGDFFTITQSKQVNIDRDSTDINFIPGTTKHIESPSLIMLDLNENNEKYWKYCTFKFSGTWGSNIYSNSTMPITEIGNNSVPTRDTVNGYRTDQIISDGVYWTEENSSQMGFQGRDLLDALSLKVAQSTSSNDIKSSSVINSLRFQFTKEDFFSKKYRLEDHLQEDYKYKTIDDEDSYIYMIYYNGNEESFTRSDFSAEELKFGKLNIGDIICVYIYRRNDIPSGSKSKVITCSKDKVTLGNLIPLTVNNGVSNLMTYETEEIDTPKWGISAFVIESNNVWSSKLPISRDLNIETYDWTIITDDTQEISPLRGLDKNFNQIKLPRGFINPGSETVSIVLDPKLKSISTSNVQFDISSYPIKYDEDTDNFYVEVDTSSQDIISLDNDKISTKQIIKFNENKYFKNILKITGAYQTIELLDDKNIPTTKGVLMPINGEPWPSSIINNEDYILGYNKVTLRSNWRNNIEPSLFKSLETLEGRLIGFRGNSEWVLSSKSDLGNQQLSNSLFKYQLMRLLPTQQNLIDIEDGIYTTFNNSKILSPKIKNIQVSSTIGSVRPNSTFESISREKSTTYFRNLGIGEFNLNLSTPNVLYFEGNVETERLTSVLSEGAKIENVAILSDIKETTYEVPTLDFESKKQFKSKDGLLKSIVSSSLYGYAMDSGFVYQILGDNESVQFKQLKYPRGSDSILEDGYELVAATTTDDETEVLTFTKTEYNHSLQTLNNPLTVMMYISDQEGEKYLMNWTTETVEVPPTLNEDGLVETATDLIKPEDVSLGKGNLNTLTSHNSGQSVYKDEELKSPQLTFTVDFTDNELNVKWTPLDDIVNQKNVTFHYDLCYEDGRDLFENYFIREISKGNNIKLNSRLELIKDTSKINKVTSQKISKVINNDIPPRIDEILEKLFEFNKMDVKDFYEEGVTDYYTLSIDEENFIVKILESEEKYGFNIIRKLEENNWVESFGTIEFIMTDTLIKIIYDKKTYLSTDWKTVKHISMENSLADYVAYIIDDRLSINSKIRCYISNSEIKLPLMKKFDENDSSTWAEIQLNIEDGFSKKLPTDNGKLGSIIKFNNEKDFGVYIDGNKASIYGAKETVEKRDDGSIEYTGEDSRQKYWTKCTIPFSTTDTLNNLLMYPVEKIEEKLVEGITTLLTGYTLLSSEIWDRQKKGNSTDIDTNVGKLAIESKPLAHWLYGKNLPEYESVTEEVALRIHNEIKSTVQSDQRWKYIKGKTLYRCGSLKIENGVATLNSSSPSTWTGSEFYSYAQMAAAIIDTFIRSGESLLLGNIIEDVMFPQSNIIFKTITSQYFYIEKSNTKRKEYLDDPKNWAESSFPEYDKVTSDEQLSLIDDQRNFNTKISFKETDNSPVKIVTALVESNKTNVFEIEITKVIGDIILLGGYKRSAKEVIEIIFGDNSSKYTTKESMKQVLGETYLLENNSDPNKVKYRLLDDDVIPVLFKSEDGGKSFSEVDLGVEKSINSFAGLSINSLTELDNKIFVTLRNTKGGSSTDGSHSSKYFELTITDSIDKTIPAWTSTLKDNIEEARGYSYIEFELNDANDSYGGKKLIPVTKADLVNSTLKNSLISSKTAQMARGAEILIIDQDNKRIILSQDLFSMSDDVEVRVLVNFLTVAQIPQPLVYLNQSKMPEYLSRTGGFLIPFSKEVFSPNDADMAYMKNEWTSKVNSFLYSLEMSENPGPAEEDVSYYPSSFRDDAYFFSKNPEESKSEITSKTDLIKNTERRTFFTWIDDRPKPFVNGEGNELLLCNEDGSMVVFDDGYSLPVTQLISQYDLGAFSKCPEPAKTQLEFAKTNIVVKEDILKTELLKELGWRQVSEILAFEEKPTITIDVGENSIEAYKNDLYITEDSGFLTSADDLSIEDFTFFRAFREYQTDEELENFYMSEKSRFQKVSMFGLTVWFDTLYNYAPLKKEKNIILDISIPYQYSGHKLEKYTTLNVDDKIRMKSLQDDSPITGMYMSYSGYGGTRTQSKWEDLPWNVDKIAFLENDALNECDGRILMSNLDGTAIIGKSTRFVEHNENVHVRPSYFNGSTHTFIIKDGDNEIKQILSKDNIIGSSTKLVFQKDNEIHINLKNDVSIVYDNDIVGYMRITDGFKDINIEYIENVTFYNDDIICNELNWTNNMIIANGTLTHLNNVKVLVEYCNDTSLSKDLIVNYNESIPDSIDLVEWDESELKTIDDFDIIYPLTVNNEVKRIDGWKPFIISSGIVHQLEYDNTVEIWIGSIINIKQNLSYFDELIIGKFESENENSVLIENFLGLIYVKQFKYGSFRSLIDNEGYSITSSNGLGSSGPWKQIGDYSLGRIGGETLVNGQNYLVFNNVINDDYLNNGNQHIIELSILTENRVDLLKEQVNDDRYYIEIPLNYITKFSPDRVYFHPEGYPKSPVSYRGRSFNTENSSYFLSENYTNANGNNIILSDEHGRMCKYVSTPSGLEVVPIPKGISYYDNELALVKKPIHLSCKDWYKSKFYVEGELQNPFWHYINLSSKYDSTKKVFETVMDYYEKIKENGVMKYSKLLDGKYANIFKTSYLVLRNNVFYMNNTAFDYKEGIIRLLLLEGDDSFVNNDNFIKYGIYASKNDILDKTKSRQISNEDDLIVGQLNVRDILLNYDCNTLENTVNILDKEKAITQITEFGLFDKFHNMIAYATFPPIEYRSDTQHLSITSIITDGNNIVEKEIVTRE